MLTIIEATTEDELRVLASFKLELMQYHIEYATRIGIADRELMQYCLEQALSTAHCRINYLLMWSGEPVGMSQVQEQISNIDFEPMLFIHSIYITASARENRISSQYLEFLCKKYSRRIECECWYGIPAGKLYEQAGFLPMVTRYCLPTISYRYGSDQN